MKFTCRTIYIYYFFKNTFERNPWNESNAFVNRTLLMLVEPQPERRISISDANTRLFYLARKKKNKKESLEESITSLMEYLLPDIEATCFLFQLSHTSEWPLTDIHLSPVYFVKIVTITSSTNQFLRGLGAKCNVRTVTITLFLYKMN